MIKLALEITTNTHTHKLENITYKQATQINLDCRINMKEKKKHEQS